MASKQTTPSPENPEQIQDQNREKTSNTAAQKAARTEAVEGTSELKREMLTENTANDDQKYIENISSINIEKSIESQSEKFDRMRLPVYAIFAKLFQKGTPLNTVQNLRHLSALPLDESAIKTPIEKAAWKKLLEIAENPGSNAFKDLDSMWSNFTKNAHEKYGTADGIQKELNGEKREKKDEKDEGVINKTVEFAKEHPYATGIALLAGAYGLYRIFRSEKKESKEEKKESSSKWPWILGGSILALFLAGALMNKEKCLKWIMERCDVPTEKITKFKELWDKGEHADAIKSIFDSGKSENNEDLSDKPGFMGVMNKYHDYSSIISHPFDFASDLSDACKKDDLNIIVGGGAIFIWNGVKMIPLAIGEAWVDIFSLQPGEYLKDSSIFIVGGALIGAAKGKGVIGTITETVKGAAKGAVFPIKAPFIAGKAVYKGVKGIEDAMNSTTGWKLRLQRSAQKIETIEAETKFYADLAKKYDDAHEAMEHTETSAKKIMAKIDAERIENLRVKYMKKFAESYSRQFPDKKITVDSKDLKDTLRKTKDTLKEYLGDATAVKPATNPQEAAQTQSQPRTENTPSQPVEVVTQKPIIPRYDGSQWNFETGKNTHYYMYEGQHMSFTDEQIAQRAGEIYAEDMMKDPSLMPKNIVESSRINWNRAINELAAEEFALTTVPQTEQPAAPIDTPEAQATVKRKFIETLKQEGKSMETINAFLDKNNFIKNSKVLKFLPTLEKILGPTAAVLTIYHLETSPDKEKAVAETAGALGAAIAGMKLAHWAIGSKINNPGMKAVIGLAGGLAGAFNLAKPIEKIVTEYLEKIPGSHSASGEIASIIEKGSAISMARSSLAKAVITKVAAKTGLETVTKTGMKALGEVFERRIAGVFTRKIGQLAARQGFKQLIKTLGWKGATAAGLLADDATAVGVIDDVLLVPLTIWMGVDLIQAGNLVKNAYKMNNEMAERNKHEMEAFHINDKASRETINKKLAAAGSSATVDDLGEINPDELMVLLKDIPDTSIDIIRAGTTGREHWTLHNGQPTSIAILDDKFDTICEMDVDDVENMDQALGNNVAKATPMPDIEMPGHRGNQMLD